MPKVLPVEMIFQIILELVWKPKMCRRTSQLQLYKNKFEPGVANACKTFRGMYMAEWPRDLTLHKAEDWEFAVGHNFAKHVRVLRLNENALPSHAVVKAHLDFSRFDLIHTLILDCHNDVGHSASLGVKGQWSYKKIIPSLPRKLKSLTILSAHGPDLQIIQKATKQCKGLESLTLGRCTKFNRPNCCEFWENFPNDHDSYFSGKGVDGYANALGTELQGLPELKSVYVNVYLTDTKYLDGANSEAAPTTQTPQPLPLPQPAPADELVTVTTKHAPNAQTQAQSQAPVISSLAQPEHRDTKSKDKEDTDEAETVAAKALFECHPALQRVGFISYWSEDHLGWSIRERKGENKPSSPDPGGEGEGDGVSASGSSKLV